MIDQSAVLLFITVALASAVEATEALTIILASGITRGWRSTFEGALLALACLAVIVGVAGTALIYYVPLYALRIVVGTLLLIFGLQWLTKAILRQTGFKAPHDERDIYDKQVATLSKEKRDSSRATRFLSVCNQLQRRAFGRHGSRHDCYQLWFS